MKTLAIVSQKGGVGKTTLSLNLACAMAARGWRTLLLETDPQGAIGLSLTEKVSSASGLAEYVARQQPLSELILKTRFKTLDLLPVGQIAIQDTLGFATTLSDGQVLRRLLTDCAKSYDLTIVDTPSGFGGITMGVLRASSHALCPIQAEPLALRSVTQLFEVNASLQRQGEAVQIAGIILTMLQNRNHTSLSVAEETWAHLSEEMVLNTVIPRDPVVMEASAAGVPVQLLRKRMPPVAKIFDQAAAELEVRLGLVEEEDGSEAQSLVV